MMEEQEKSKQEEGGNQREDPQDRGQPSQVVGITKAQKKKKDEGKKESNNANK